MKELISFLVSREAILVYIIAVIVSVLYVMFCFMKNTGHKRKKKQNTMELNKLVEEVKKEEMKITTDNHQEVLGEAMKEVLTLPKEETLPGPIPVVEEQKIKVENTVPLEQKPENIVPINTVISSVEEKTPVVENNIPEIKIIEEKPMVIEQNIESIMPVTPNSLEKIEEVPENVEKESSKIEEKKEKIVYTSIEPEQEEAKKQLAEITEKLEQEKEENIELTEFERMQEDTAIISLDELMKKANEMYEKNEETQYQDEGNEPISLADLEKRKQEVIMMNQEENTTPSNKPEQLTLDSFEQVKISSVSELKPIAEEPKFKSSPVISPVYGIEKEKTDFHRNTELELENTANYDKLDAEIRKTNQFIAALKELQKKLD